MSTITFLFYNLQLPDLPLSSNNKYHKQYYNNDDALRSTLGLFWIIWCACEAWFDRSKPLFWNIQSCPFWNKAKPI